MPTPSFADRLLYWEQLVESLTSHVETVPGIKGPREELAALIAKIRENDMHAQLLRANLRETVAQRRTFEDQSAGLATRISALLRAEFGFESERLIEFGLKPRSRNRRRSESPAPTPSASGQAPAEAKPAA